MNGVEVRRLLGISLYITFAWVAGLIVLVVACVRLLRFLGRLLAALASTTRCGHCAGEVEQYARWRCRCGGVNDGWAWRCPTCRGWSGWVACEHCGMATTNPLLRG